MEFGRYVAGIMTLCLVTVIHLIGFNNIRVLNIFWLPELILILYVVFSLVPTEQIQKWQAKYSDWSRKKQKQEKVVPLKPSKRNRLPALNLLDAVLVSLVLVLALLIIYRI